MFPTTFNRGPKKINPKTGKSYRAAKDEDLKEKASLLVSGRDLLPETRLYHATDNVELQNRLGNELMEWVDKEDSLLLDTFPLSKRMAPRWFYNMASKNPYFEQCLSYAKARLGERMEEKLKNNPLYLQKALPLYSTLWIEAEDKKLKENANTITVYETVGIPVIKGGSDE